MTRHNVLAGLMVCALSAPSSAQVRLFLAVDGQQAAAPQTGSTSVHLDPGTTATLMIWIQDTIGGQLLHGYQLILLDDAAALCAASGSVAYVDVNPGAGGGNSVFLNTTRSDWVFDLEIVALTPTYNESPASGIFGVVYNTFPTSGVDLTQPGDVPLPGGIHYLVQFNLAASADACGDFELDFNQPPATGPHTVLFLPNGEQFEVDELQPLTISTRPLPENNDCVQAAVAGDGSHPFSTVCASTDGPDQPGSPPAGCQQFALSTNVHNDVWFEYTAPCTGTLVASTCDDADFDTKIAAYHPDASCPPSADDLLGCNDGVFGCGSTSRLEVQVTALQTYLLRVGGSAAGATGAGDLTLTCQQECTPGLPVNDPLTLQQCGNPGPCADVGCGFLEGCVLAPTSAGTPCDDFNACTAPDSCNGAGARLSGPPLTCDDFDPCTLDNCLLVGGCVHPIIPGAPCDSGGGPGSGTCSALGDCEPNAQCASVADCADTDGDGSRDDVCMWWACTAGRCAGSEIVYGDVGGSFGDCAPDGTPDNNDVFHVLNCFANQDTLGNPLAYPCEDDPPAAYNVDPAGQFGSCAPDGVCDVNDVFAVLNAFGGTTRCSCPAPAPAPESDAPQQRPRAPGGKRPHRNP